METPKHDRELLKHDVLRMLRHAFGDRTPQLFEMANMMVESFDELHAGSDFIRPDGKNIYSLRYTVRMTLEGDHKVRGENVREARQNLLTILTQELSLRDLVAQSVVMPICPIRDIDIKEPELLHGIEPYYYYIPYMYTPKENAMRLALDEVLEQIADIINDDRPLTAAQKEKILSGINDVKQKYPKRDGHGLDLNNDAVEFLKDFIRKNPEKMQELLKEWEDDDRNWEFPKFVRGVLGEE